MDLSREQETRLYRTLKDAGLDPVKAKLFATGLRTGSDELVRRAIDTDAIKQVEADARTEKQRKEDRDATVAALREMDRQFSAATTGPLTPYGNEGLFTDAELLKMAADIERQERELIGQDSAGGQGLSAEVIEALNEAMGL